MLEALKKAFGNKPDETLEQLAPNTEANASVELQGIAEASPELVAALASLADKENFILNLNGKIEEMANEIEGYKQQLESLSAFAAEAEAAAQAAVEEMKAKELSDKKAQLADVIGQENPAFDTTWAAVASLEGEAFNVVLNGFKAAFAAEAASPLFTEVGLSGEAELTSNDEESATMRIIQKTYQQ